MIHNNVTTERPHNPDLGRLTVVTYKRKLPRRMSGFALGLIYGLVCFSTASADPQGGVVVGGQGAISRPDFNTTVIQQRSNSLAINWDSFNVARHERVVFNQPSASAVALNRIFDQNPSQIFSAIDANGRIFLMNPNGLIFGSSATINVGSLLASTLDISVDDFMNGRYELQALRDRSGGFIINRGLLQAATGGSITLVGESVSNEGVIVADYGSVNLAAGRRATLDFDGDGLLLFEIDAGIIQNNGLDISPLPARAFSHHS